MIFSYQQQRTLLTHNRVDFELLHQMFATTQQHHCGILIATHHPPYDIARRLLALLGEVTADEMYDQLRYI